MTEAADTNTARPQHKRRWYRFSLRSLLIFTVLCAIVCGRVGREIEDNCNKPEETGLRVGTLYRDVIAAADFAPVGGNLKRHEYIVFFRRKNSNAEITMVFERNADEGLRLKSWSPAN